MVRLIGRWFSIIWTITTAFPVAKTQWMFQEIPSSASGNERTKEYQSHVQMRHLSPIHQLWLTNSRWLPSKLPCWLALAFLPFTRAIFLKSHLEMVVQLTLENEKTTSYILFMSKINLRHLIKFFEDQMS